MKTYLKVFAEAYWYIGLFYIASLIAYLAVGLEGFEPSWKTIFSPIPFAVFLTFFHLRFGMFTECFGKEYLKSVDKRQK